MTQVQTHIPTGTGRERLLQLAQPKEHRKIWITSCGPRITWGNQETLWPVNASALAAKPTGRLVGLARPKLNFQTGDNLNRPGYMYSCGRSSVIWTVNPVAMRTEASGRLQTLAGHKQPPDSFQESRPHYVFSCGRASPIWKVSKGAAACNQRTRTEVLAGPKTVHPQFKDNREVQTKIPHSALRASANERIESLAAAKSRPEGPFREPQWPVSDEVKKASPSGRSLELAKHKSTVEGYIAPREVIWPVSRGALKASATPRMEELSAPIVRASMDHVQFDPNAFIVKVTALKGRASQRVEELAQPIQR